MIAPAQRFVMWCDCTSAPGMGLEPAIADDRRRTIAKYRRRTAVMSVPAFPFEIATDETDHAGPPPPTTQRSDDTEVSDF